ncbi:calponin homology domain-containing protein DDB_G0272472-like isoform X5 [Sebastes umbrosus]|uniref:calponin homology domain-containing protein DDB_G0272472-like isoform X5 n=1 Tax=Sebastes umbrosus TaxID=72105 RepID=UPI00189C7527|nr:calponin homology domain-containing protein DDB_G0272472-like isoform X5 [Sebastes umbrosus]
MELASVLSTVSLCDPTLGRDCFLNLYICVFQSLNQELVEAATQQAPSKEMQYLRRALMDVQKQNFEHAAETAALREQMAAKESSWEEEKMRILKALKLERLIREEAQKGLKGQDEHNPDLQVQLLQTPSNQLKDSHQHNTELAAEIAALKQQMAAKESRWELEKNKMLTQVQIYLQNKEQENQKVINSLRQSLLEKLSGTMMVKQTPSNQLKDSHQVTELAAENAALREQMAANESSWKDEKMRILKALRSERLIRKDAQKDLKGQDKQNPDLQVQLLQTPSNQLKDSHQHNTELAAEIAALKQQMAAKESRWELEKNKIRMAQRAIKIQAQKQEVTDSLSQSLFEKQNEIMIVKQTISNQLKDSQQVTELAAENAALREQMAAKESGWELEKNKILIQVQNDLQTKEQEKQEVTDSLSQSLLEKQNEIVMIKQLWTEKCIKACEAWKEENREIRETCERELQSALDQKNLMVKSLQDESDRKVSQVVLEKDDLITRMTTAKMALEAEWTTKLAALEDQTLKNEVRLKEKEMQLLQSEAKWSTKLAPLEDQIRLQTDTTTDLQAQLLRLQELHQKLDLGALQMTAEEMNAKKKELKKLIVEKEKEEKRQKKEREEREKREKKESEEREKEELKSVKKEKEALEKKEKEDLKREKKERKEKERREK